MTNLKHRIAAIALATVIGVAQGSAQAPMSFDNCSEIRSVLFVRGDLLHIACDTVYVLNILTFRRYDAAYKDLRKKGPSISNLMSAYDEIISLQEQRLATQQNSFDELRLNFNNLAGTTSTTIEGSAAQLTLAVTSIDSLKSDMIETKRLLGETQEILESEKRGINLEKLLWGAGGLAAGLILGVVISQ
jgi:hypothetical protein